MAEPFIGEIRQFAFAFAPEGWATCDGQLLDIAQNAALFSLLGTTYGGDGVKTFRLPDFRGRAIMHRSVDYREGYAGGRESVALASTSQLPVHTHALTANSDAGSSNLPADDVLAAVAAAGKLAYAAAKGAPAANLAAGTLSPEGASASHGNMQPSLTINLCIALTGYYPQRP